MRTKEKKDHRNLANAMSELFRRNGWSQNQAANHYGVDHATVVRWLSAKFAPRPVILRQMVKDSSSHPDLLPRFEEYLGKTAAQVMLESAKYAARSNCSKPHPDANIDQIYLAFEDCGEAQYREARAGDKKAKERLLRAIDQLYPR